MDENVQPDPDPTTPTPSDDAPEVPPPPAASADASAVEASADAAAVAAPGVDAPAADAPAADAPAADAPAADAPAADLPAANPVPATPERSGRIRVAGGVAVVALAAAVGVGIGTLASDDEDDPDPAAAEAEADSGEEFPEMPGGDDVVAMRSDIVGGTIEDVGNSSLTIDTGDDDPVEVAVDDDTVLTDTEEIDTADLEVGDAVRTIGDTSDDGSSVEAMQITTSDDEDLLDNAGGVGPVGGGGPPGNGGEIPDIAVDELEEPPTLPDGEQIEDFEGMPSAPPEARSNPATAGTIESIDGDTITVTTDDGDRVTVTASSSTTVQRISEISLDDLAEGDEVTVFAEDDDGTLTATAVRRGEDLAIRVMPGRPDAEQEDDADAEPGSGSGSGA